MIGYLLLPLFLVPVVALGWRVVVSKTRSQWLRAGAAAVAMLTLMGGFLIADDLQSLRFEDWRVLVEFAASASGSLYLLMWSRRKHGNRRHRTISIIAAIIGLVPVAAGLLATTVFGGEL